MIEHPSIMQVNRTGYPVRNPHIAQSLDSLDRCGCNRKAEYRFGRQRLCEQCAIEGGFI